MMPKAEWSTPRLEVLTDARESESFRDGMRENTGADQMGLS